MTAFNFDDLVEPLTTDEVSTSIYNVLGIVGVDTTTWKPGAITRAIVTACAVVLSAFSVLMAEIAKAGFKGLASSHWLTANALYMFDVTRIEATHATGPVLLSNSSGNLYNLDPYDLTVSNSTSEKEYRNTAAITLNPGASNVSAEAEAVEAGSASTAQIGEVDTVVTPLTGVTVTNAAALVGLDAENDAALKTRCDDKLGSLSPAGPRDAYRWAAVTAVNQAGDLVGVTRARSYPDGFGNVPVYVAGALATISGSASNPATDLGAVQEAILADAAPLGVTPQAIAAPITALAITYEVTVFNTVGVTANQLKDEISVALTAYLSAYPIGGASIPPAVGKLYQSDLIRVIGAVRPEIFNVSITTPAADYTMTLDEALILGALTGTVTQVAPPGQ